jgi:hypothetical protein
MSGEHAHGRREHAWRLVERRDDERGVVRLERCDCGRFRATVLFDAPAGQWIDLGAFLADLDRLGVRYAATIRLSSGQAGET